MAGKKPIRQKHAPQRTCIVCRQKGDKRQFTRIVRTEEGVQVDPSGKKNGRGAYICEKTTCWDKVLNTSIMNNALKTELTAAEKVEIARHKPKETPASV